MSDISKFLFISKKQPTYVVYKTSFPAIESIYRLLENIGFDSWKDELNNAIEENQKISFYTGVGRAINSFENINCISLSETIFFLGDDISWSDNEITIENVTFYLVEESDGVWMPKPKWHTDYLTLDIGTLQHSQIIKTIEERRADFLYDTDEDDTEFLAFQDDRSDSLGEFNSEDGTIFTVDWDDLDDLMLISMSWPFLLKFSND
jgi:hypothetical protein